jgi:uncharacterized protein (DUF433 family)
MEGDFMNKYIDSNTAIMNGKPCIKGTRIPVYIILEMLAEGLNYKDILTEYPQLTMEQILACCNFGALMSKYEEFELV